ncbi:MAG: 50S ribosomal protein L15 [Bacteroidota bacterium]
MELHNLKAAKGATKSKKRIARGQGSGTGGTSTRGHKGAKSRSGWSRKRNFEGGQMPLQMRLPKRGFKSPNRVEYTVFNLAQIQKIADKYNISDITPDILKEKKIIKKRDLIKVLANGSLSSTVNVTANAFSEAAKKSIEEKGGTATVA